MIKKNFRVISFLCALLILLVFMACSGKKKGYLDELSKNPENHYHIGSIYLGDGNFLQAEMEFKKAIELSPDNPKYYNALGLAYFFSGRLYNATEQLKKAVALAPREPDFHNNLGTAYKEMGEFDMAKEEYRIVFQITSYPAMFKTYYNMAQIYEKEKNWDEAFHYLHKSLELNSNTPYTHNQIGLVLENQNKMQEALKHYRTALRIDPEFIPANYNIAVALFKLGRRTEAAGYFEKVIQKTPESEMAEKAREFSSKIKSN